LLQPLILPPGLGIYQWDPSTIVGPRQRKSIAGGPNAILASSFGRLTVNLNLPVIDNSQAIFIEYLSGFLTLDDTGNLQISQLSFSVVDSTPTELLELAQPEFTIAFPFGRSGLIFPPPPYLTLFDLTQFNGGTLPAQPLMLQLIVGALNVDAVNPHNLSVNLSAMLRIISGIREA
jgi:hypothetical protein